MRLRRYSFDKKKERRVCTTMKTNIAVKPHWQADEMDIWNCKVSNLNNFQGQAAKVYLE